MAEDLIGRRIVLRRRVGRRDGRPTFTDILGVLVANAGGTLTVRKEGGALVTVPATEVHRLRAVPPGRADIVELERVCAAGWPAPETAALGEWLLRAGEGWTRRANSALVLGDPGRPLAEALDYVRAWYAERALTPRLVTPLPAAAAADHAAATLGWVSDVEVDVLSGPVPATHPDPGVRFSSTPDAGWAAAYRSRTVPPVGMRILTGPRLVTFASLDLDGTTVAIGRGVVAGERLGITAMEVLAEHRGQGLGRRVLRALFGWGVRHGASRCHLQVEIANRPAIALYTGHGLTRHHRCRNRYADPVDRTEHRGERERR